MDCVDLLLHGIATSTYCNELSVSQRAMVGMLTYEASTTACLSDFGSATINNLGSWNFLVFWLVRVPGVHLADEVDLALVCWAYLITALCPYGLAQTTITSSGFSTVTITLAASLIFYQVSSTFKIWTPSLVLWSTYFLISEFKFGVPTWVYVASNLRMSSCFLVNFCSAMRYIWELEILLFMVL